MVPELRTQTPEMIARGNRIREIQEFEERHGYVTLEMLKESLTLQGRPDYELREVEFAIAQRRLATYEACAMALLLGAAGLRGGSGAAGSLDGRVNRLPALTPEPPLVPEVKLAPLVPHNALVEDFTKNPSDWERIGTQVGTTPSGRYKGGVNIESQWRNKLTNEELSIHEAFDTLGRSIHPENASPNIPAGASVRPRNRAKELQ